MQDEVINQIQAHISDARIYPKSEGNNFTVDVVSAEFESLPGFKRQQLVLKAVKELITSGAIHAFTVHAYTPQEWQQNSRLNIL